MADATIPRVYLDTNIFIAAYEKDDALGSDLSKLFQAFRARPKVAVTSELTLAELTIRPGSPRRFYHGLLVANTFVDFLPVTRSILLDLGSFRDASGKAIKLADAIHGVTAVQARCNHVLSADKGFTLPFPITRIDPSHDGLSSLVDALRA